MDSNLLRREFTGFFTSRDHTLVPSAPLVPHHPAAPLFNVAGMVPFIPYFLGEETAPWKRATSVQKCFRTADIDIIGSTQRHLTFFEMLGNFSFGDYFKERAIPLAWELVTEVFGLDPDRLWVTVHTSDDDAEVIWRDAVGVAADRIQRLDDDNWWEMAKGGTGPCGPCSEIYVDKGPAYGPDGGPAKGGDERFLEIWNLVFMQFNRQPDGTLGDLPRKNIDTGAGLERIVPILQGKDSVFETDVVRPIIDTAESITGRRYGDDERTDVSLRILADHARAMSFLVGDGVSPSNEDRGYVLRRIIRRAVRHAYQLGVNDAVTPRLIEATGDVLGEAWPELVRKRDVITDVVLREEERFRERLRTGISLLDRELDAGIDRVPGAVAFQLHDTYGFPIELTREIAAERGVSVDDDEFALLMSEQRTRAKAARKTVAAAGDGELYRDLVERFGTTEFTGYGEYQSTGKVLEVLSTGDDSGDDAVEIFLDRTPFYAEGGGQVGDTGTITTPTGTARVLDTTYALPGLHRHRARIVEGDIEAGQEATATIDGDRRDATRRNHTATHMLHWALREVLGPHVQQKGSLVDPDRLRFDFSHYQPVTADELAKVEALATERVLHNEPVRAYETTMEEAQKMGAIAFFGDKYGEVVRVVEAGGRSMELCGGTHVNALGMIGPIKIVSEGSIGTNLRRIEALTGTGALEHIRHEEDLLERVADILRVKADELPERIERELAGRRALEEELKALRRQAAGGEAQQLAAQAVDGVVVVRIPDERGIDRNEVRDLALAVREQPNIRAVVLGAVPEGGGVALVAAVAKGSGLVAHELLADAARTVGGGGGKNPDLAIAGGRDASRLDEALDQARAAASVAS